MIASPVGRLDFADRRGIFERLDGSHVDLVVIGAGITGSGVARDAALRGLSVVLVDAGDIACGTSSRSSKMIHGGLRYLAQGDIDLVREAARERQTLRAIAPHLTQICPFVLPGSRTQSAKLRAGLATFERLGRVPSHERHEVWNAAQLAELEPCVRRGPSSAVVYPEFLTNDARLTLANARSAVAAGAQVVTHAPVARIVVELGRASGVELRGALPGETGLGATIHAGAVVNAAGPWVDAVRALEDAAAPSRLQMTKGVHLVVPHERLPLRRTVVTIGADKRTVFAVPRGEVTYLGTTDTFHPGPDSWPAVDRGDVDYLKAFWSASFEGPPLADTDMVAGWAGVRPLIAQAGKAPSEISRKDETWIGPAGVVTIAGGKLTAYRTMAERVVDLVVARTGRTAGPCRTAEVPLVGGDLDLEAVRATLGSGPATDRLLGLYGSEAPAIAAAGGGIEAEVAHAVHHEGALTLTDVWVRRTARAWFTLDPIGPDLTLAARTMGELLGWSAERQAAELAETTAHHHDALAFDRTPAPLI